MSGYFGDETLALSFTFQAKYLGMSPWNCPGLFSIIPYIEHAFGIYHPIGGLSRISDTMAETARANGATIRLNACVRRVLTRGRAASGVELADGERIEADDVVLNADFGHAALNLFEPGTLRKYTPDRLERMKLSCSTFMLYLGVDRTYDTPHHMIAFADDYRANVNAISAGRRTPRDVSVYVRNASVTDPTLAPPGHSALYVLVPVANLRGETDWKTEGPAFRETVLEALETRCGLADLRRHIRAEQMITPNEWRDDFRVYQGATFNLAHNLGQMVYLRPRNQFEELAHCYLVGGGTHPGSGLPTIYESGRIAANLICRAHGVVFESCNIHI
jgi:phytoene desaturase